MLKTGILGPTHPFLLPNILSIWLYNRFQIATSIQAQKPYFKQKDATLEKTEWKKMIGNQIQKYRYI